MALRDIFKRKKKAVKPKKEPSYAKATEGKKEKPKKEETPKKEINQAVPPKQKTLKSKIAFGILKAPHITEKATDLAAHNQYIFRVYPKANKNQIREAIEELYNVDVLDVKIIKIPKKRRMVKGKIGWRKGYKKAIIKIKKGQKIEVMPR